MAIVCIDDDASGADWTGAIVMALIGMVGIGDSDDGGCHGYNSQGYYLHVFIAIYLIF